MTIREIKSFIEQNINKPLSFKINGSRNQVEEFNGQIISMYNSIFLVKDENNAIKSFTYSDVLIKNLIIYVKR